MYWKANRKTQKLFPLSKIAENLPSISIPLTSIIRDTSCEKDAYCICEQRIFRSVCDSTQTNQDNHILLDSIPNECRTKRPMDKTSHAIFDQVDKTSHVIFFNVDKTSHMILTGWTKCPMLFRQGGQNVPCCFDRVDKTSHILEVVLGRGEGIWKVCDNIPP